MTANSFSIHHHQYKNSNKSATSLQSRHRRDNIVLSLKLLFLLLCTIQQYHSVTATICIHYVDPIHPEIREFATCPDIEVDFQQLNGTIPPTPTSISSVPHQQHQGVAISPFMLDLTCWADKVTCEAVEKTCKRAGDIIADAIDIVEPIRVQLQYIPFCFAYKICPAPQDDGEIVLGRGRPAITHLMQDAMDGNHVREYPQALLKQFRDLSPHPAYSGNDIIAMLNSEVNWYFDEEDTQPIQSNQVSFLLTVLHEYIHGLGFLSSYSDTLYTNFKRVDTSIPAFLTPTRYIPPDANPSYVAAPNLMAPQGFWGFFENVFDKYFCYQAGNYQRVRITHLTDYFNQFYNGNTVFASALEFILAWLRSPQATVATALEKAAITPGTFKLTFEARDPDANTPMITLYTSGPDYRAGTSISHFDTNTYKFSPDFLMIPTAEMNGMTLKSVVERNNNGDAKACPIGPQLLRFLNTLGYKSNPTTACTNGCSDGCGDDDKQNNPSAGLSIYHPPSNLVGTPGNPSPEPVSIDFHS